MSHSKHGHHGREWSRKKFFFDRWNVDNQEGVEIGFELISTLWSNWNQVKHSLTSIGGVRGTKSREFLLESSHQQVACNLIVQPTLHCYFGGCQAISFIFSRGKVGPMFDCLHVYLKELWFCDVLLLFVCPSVYWCTPAPQTTIQGFSLYYKITNLS